MTPELIGAASGTALSLFFNLVPGAKEWYDSHSTKWQKLAMVVLTFLTAIGITFWSCANPSVANLSPLGVCLSGIDWVSVLVVWASTYIPNQAVDRGTPKPGDGKELDSIGKQDFLP